MVVRDLFQGRLVTILPVAYFVVFLFQVVFQTLDGFISLSTLTTQRDRLTGRSESSCRLTRLAQVAVL